MAGKKGRSGRPRVVKDPKEFIRDYLPVKEIFDKDELKIFNSLTTIYLQDFEDDDLSASDMDDLISLSINRVLEFRLLKESQGSAEGHLNVSQSIERLRKQNQKIKENLASRRSDRGDDIYKEFSIVDLAVSFDEAKRLKLKTKEDKLLKEEEEIVKTRKKRKFVGNADDKDREVKNRE